MSGSSVKFKVTKALIPVAGLGRRMLPQSQAVPKALLPVLTRDNRLVPLIHLQLEEILEAGIERIALVVSPWDETLFRAHFSPSGPGYLPADRETERYPDREWIFLGKAALRIDYIIQNEPLGLGHAVLQAESWAGDEPVLLILGDHLFQSAQNQSCFRQLLKKMRSDSRCRLAVTRLPVPSSLSRGYAVLEEKPGALIRPVRRIAYPPDVPAHGDSPEEYLPLLGAAVLVPGVFEILRELEERDIRRDGEIQLSEALEILREIDGLEAVLVDGKSLEMGDPRQYMRAFFALTEYDLTA